MEKVSNEKGKRSVSSHALRANPKATRLSQQRAGMWKKEQQLPQQRLVGSEGVEGGLPSVSTIAPNLQARSSERQSEHAPAQKDTSLQKKAGQSAYKHVLQSATVLNHRLMLSKNNTVSSQKKLQPYRQMQADQTTPPALPPERRTDAPLQAPPALSPERRADQGPPALSPERRADAPLPAPPTSLEYTGYTGANNYTAVTEGENAYEMPGVPEMVATRVAASVKEDDSCGSGDYVEFTAVAGEQREASQFEGRCYADKCISICKGNLNSHLGRMHKLYANAQRHMKDILSENFFLKMVCQEAQNRLHALVFDQGVYMSLRDELKKACSVADGKAAKAERKEKLKTCEKNIKEIKQYHEECSKIFHKTQLEIEAALAKILEQLQKNEALLDRHIAFSLPSVPSGTARRSSKPVKRTASCAGYVGDSCHTNRSVVVRRNSTASLRGNVGAHNNIHDFHDGGLSYPASSATMLDDTDGAFMIDSGSSASLNKDITKAVPAYGNKPTAKEPKKVDKTPNPIVNDNNSDDKNKVCAGNVGKMKQAFELEPTPDGQSEKQLASLGPKKAKNVSSGKGENSSFRQTRAKGAQKKGK